MTDHATGEGTEDAVTARLIELFTQIVAGQTAVSLQDQLADRGAMAAQLEQARALALLAERVAVPTATVDPAQSRVEVRFRALQSGLGGAGRMRHTAVPPLMVSPRLHRDGRLEFLADLPARAWSLRLTGTDGHGAPVERVVPLGDRSTTDLVLDGATGVTAVEALDADGVTLQFGIPVRSADTRRPSRRN